MRALLSWVLGCLDYISYKTLTTTELWIRSSSARVGDFTEYLQEEEEFYPLLSEKALSMSCKPHLTFNLSYKEGAASDTVSYQLLTLFPTSFHSLSSLFIWKESGHVSRVQPLACRGSQGGKLRLLSHSLPPKASLQYGLQWGSSGGAGFSPRYHSNLFLWALI